MDNAHTFNRVLLTAPIGWVERPDGKKGVVVDGTSLSFIIEELVALSAVSVVISSRHHAASFVDTLDPVIRKRVEVVDENQSYRQFMALFEPVTDEFLVEYDIGFSCDAEPMVRDALSNIYFSLSEYFIAKNHKTELDIDIKKLAKSIVTVRGVTNSPAARAVLSVMQGILNVYCKHDVNSLRVIPQARGQLISAFDDLVEDKLYQEASKETHKIGFPILAERSLIMAGRALEIFLNKTPFRHILNLGGRAIESATSIPVPSSDMAQELLSAGYLPPITKIGNTVSTALKKWEQVKPDPIYPISFP